MSGLFFKIALGTRLQSKECDISHYWYFLGKGFKFQANVCNGCHNILMMFMKLSNTTNLNIQGADYCCIRSGIGKSEAIKVMQNIDLAKEKRSIIKHKILLSYTKKCKDVWLY